MKNSLSEFYQQKSSCYESRTAKTWGLVKCIWDTEKTLQHILVFEETWHNSETMESFKTVLVLRHCYVWPKVEMLESECLLLAGFSAVLLKFMGSPWLSWAWRINLARQRCQLSYTSLNLRQTLRFLQNKSVLGIVDVIKNKSIPVLQKLFWDWKTPTDSEILKKFAKENRSFGFFSWRLLIYWSRWLCEILLLLGWSSVRLQFF